MCLLRYRFSISHSSIKSKYGGETANAFFIWFKQLAHPPTYWSRSFSLNKYLSFTPLKSDPTGIHSSKIRGVTVLTTSTILATPLQQEWNPRYPLPKPSLLSYLSKFLTSFVNCIIYRVYCDFTLKSGTSPFNTSGQQKKYCDNGSTGQHHIFDGFA